MAAKMLERPQVDQQSTKQIPNPSRRVFIKAAMAGIGVVAAAHLLPNSTLEALAQEFKYDGGFGGLHDILGDEIMGRATSNPFADSKGTGDVQQTTEKGLAFWRKATNIPTYTNGNEHWAITATDQGDPTSKERGKGLAYWTGTSIDPPGLEPGALPTGPGTEVAVEQKIVEKFGNALTIEYQSPNPAVKIEPTNPNLLQNFINYSESALTKKTPQGTRIAVPTTVHVVEYADLTSDPVFGEHPDQFWLTVRRDDGPGQGVPFLRSRGIELFNQSGDKIGVNVWVVINPDALQYIPELIQSNSLDGLEFDMLRGNPEAVATTPTIDGWNIVHSKPFTIVPGTPLSQ